MKGFDREEFLNFINQKWKGDKNCPLCGVNSWNIGPVVAPNLLQDGGVVFGAGMIPMVPVVCESCGYMLFFNPAVTQLIKNDPPKPPEPEGDATGRRIDS